MVRKSRKEQGPYDSNFFTVVFKTAWCLGRIESIETQPPWMTSFRSAQMSKSVWVQSWLQIA